MNHQDLILKEKHVYKAFIKLAFPLMIAHLLSSIHTLLDTYFLGQLHQSSILQASISTSWTIIQLFLTLGMGLSAGSIAILSQLHGQNEQEKEEEYATILFLFFVLIGILAGILLYFFCPVLLVWMNILKKDEKIYYASISYIRIRSLGCPFLFIFYIYQAIHHAKGDTFHPLILSFLNILFHVILSYLFLFHYSLGIKGSSLSTVISELLITPLILYSLLKKRTIWKKPPKITKEKCLSILKISFPTGMSQIITHLGFIFVQSLILSFGSETVSGISIANQVTNILLIPIVSCSIILSTFVGQNIGAKNKERAKRFFRISTHYILIFSMIAILLFYPLKNSLFHLMTKNENTYQVAKEYFPWTLFTLPIVGLFENILGLFHGSGHTKDSFFLSTIRLWILRLPLLYVFIHFFHLERNSTWYSMTISNILILILGYLFTKRITYEVKIKERRLS